MNRKTFQLSDLPLNTQKFRGNALTNPLYIEALEIRRKFLETEIYQPDHFTFRLISDFIDCTKLGWVVKKQISKMREAILKYGRDSTFWVELEHTKSLRRIQTNRVSNAILVSGEMLVKGGLTRETRREFYGFKCFALDLRKKLMVNPLSEKQFKVLWKIERLCGIFYSDLSAKENGEVWEGIEND